MWLFAGADEFSNPRTFVSFRLAAVLPSSLSNDHLIRTMFRSLQRLPLRRCVHTSTTRPANAFLNGRVGLAVGASAVLTSYAAWRAFRAENQIALDSATHRK